MRGVAVVLKFLQIFDPLLKLFKLLFMQGYNLIFTYI